VAKRLRIVTVGGGPAGLYFSLLAKKADPSRRITVVERNPADATFGWGVVFSEETLGALRDADRPTYEEITDTFARWDASDLRFAGETVRSRGHSFSAIGRKRLLNILQRRCADLGVELTFEREVDGIDQLARGADLVIAADGVNSLARATYQEAFQPTLQVHRTKFVWFGTDRAFPAFTFIFRNNEHGLFQVHAYPFDAHTSTFIVECPEETWRRAGLATATEDDSIAYCEKLFEQDLEGHPLLSNRSLWTTFVTVRCESWHHGRLALVGDAAHTAHFTIGSGTKLAMEDAIALSEALDRRRDVQQALVDYELERQPVVERFQQAASDSAAYFESVRRYASFEPVQFAFNLLTRSGRITHLELERRDARFVRSVDAWFARRSRRGRDGDPGATSRLGPPPMFAPIDLRGTTLRNRVVVADVGHDDAQDGHPGRSTEERLLDAARSGAALVVTELVAVSAHGRISPGTPGLFDDAQSGTWAELVLAIRAELDVALGVRLGHSGARGAVRPRAGGADRPLREGAWPLVAASPLPYAPRSQTPHEMDARTFREVTDDFVSATVRAVDAGFDLLMLDLSQGYLLAGFLSPLTNRRADAYGGALEGRLRFPLQVVDAVREAWPPDRPLGVRLIARDWVPGGLDLDDGVAIARSLRDRGVDLVQPVAGFSVPATRPQYGRLHLVSAADRVRNEASVTTLAAGAITTNDDANTILAAGRADLCVLDPSLHDAAEGHGLPRSSIEP